MKSIAYELRDLTAEDMFPMFQIISKIGVSEFKTAFESASVKDALSKNDGSDGSIEQIGIAVAFDLAGIILSNISKAKDDIFLLLANLSGMKKSEIASLPMATFTNMVIDVIKKEEFNDFFQVVSTSFK